MIDQHHNSPSMWKWCENNNSTTSNPSENISPVWYESFTIFHCILWFSVSHTYIMFRHKPYLKLYLVDMAQQPTWKIAPISSAKLYWGEQCAGQAHSCRICGILLLTGEHPRFCCGPGGSKYHQVPPLPPLPAAYQLLLDHHDISWYSRILNLIFSFAALETSHAFPNIDGLPGFLAIQGRVYHHVRPTHTNSAVRWLLYDGFMQNIPHPTWAALLPPPWIDAVRHALIAFNPFVTALQQYSFILLQYPNVELVLQDLGTAEIAAIMSYDNTTQSQIKARHLIISHKSGHSQAIPTVSCLWEPLAYPLLFPHGTLGWGWVGDYHHVTQSANDGDEANVVTTQIWYYRAHILCEEHFWIFRRLTNEYIVDMFSRDLKCRLNYIQTNQLHLWREDAALMDAPELESTENIYLPASFLGSRRWASNQITDSLAIAAAKGNPTFFITMTCNSNWPEIQSQLRFGQDFTDIPVVVVRVFKHKLTHLLQTLKTMLPNAGRVLYCTYTFHWISEMWTTSHSHSGQICGRLHAPRWHWLHCLCGNPPWSTWCLIGQYIHAPQSSVTKSSSFKILSIWTPWWNQIMSFQVPPAFTANNHCRSWRSYPLPMMQTRRWDDCSTLCPITKKIRMLLKSLLDHYHSFGTYW